MSKFNFAKKIVLSRLLPKKVKSFIWRVFSLDANQFTKNGKSLLNVITESGNLVGIEFLLNHGACITAFNRMSGYNIFHIAAFQGRFEIIDYLYKKGINANLTTSQGETALMLAIMCKHEKVVSYLIDKNVDFNIVDKNKKSALHYTAASGHKDFSQLLLRKGISVNRIDINGKTALEYAVENNHKDIITLFINHILLKNIKEKKPTYILNTSYSSDWDQIENQIRTVTLKNIQENIGETLTRAAETRLVYSSSSSLFNLSFQAVSRNAIDPPNLTVRTFKS